MPSGVSREGTGGGSLEPGRLGVGPEAPWRLGGPAAKQKMSNPTKTALLLGGMSGLLLLLGEALGGAQGLVLGFLFAVATNFASFLVSDKIVLRVYGAVGVGA